MNTDDAPGRLTHATPGLLSALQGAVGRPTLQRRGRVCAALSGVLRVSGLQVHAGQLCRVLASDGAERGVVAEALGFSADGVLLVPFGPMAMVNPGAMVLALDQVHSVAVGPHLLGRTVDGFGVSLDGHPVPSACPRRAVLTAAGNPLARPPIDRVLPSGVRALDAFATLGCGQRIGLFAVAGGGKTTLQRMLARHCAADVIVLALVGERGRELNETLHALDRAKSREHMVCVVSTADRPALERARACFTATAIAEHFCGQGAQVLLLVDSLTRYARAQRELGLALGEAPTRRGYPVSVFSGLAQLAERAGPQARGSITAIYTVLVEDEQLPDPVAEEVRSLLDGHIVLSRALGEAGQYPAIDVLASLSRVMPSVVTRAHWHDAQQARALLAKFRDIEMLHQVGEYVAGQDAQADRALAAQQPMAQYLRQEADQKCTLADSRAQLAALLAELPCL